MSKVIEELKKNNNIEPPQWASFVKTGAFKERPPLNDDWWYERVASVLRKVRKYGPIGTNKLSKYYGGRRKSGFKPTRKYDGSRNILRKSLQQLEAAGYIKHSKERPGPGKIITKEGKELLKKEE